MKIVTIKEVSEFLKVKQSTLYSWVNRRLIPSFKLNGLWRFDMERIEAWVMESHSVKVMPQKITKKTTRNQDINRIIKHAIEAVHGNEQS
ncbi:MAG: DNA-binding protein [Candidatus Jettenia sp.]|uniref:Putative phage transcriptional regulator n=1 Tax=Candidatus Jettenia caeni TaxID=247490 RepID=I3ILY9_9BACT|nr:helix-turn-helix domain-containing protein [Candidatus Jettenia sp. AMX1]MBC6928139.1 DNA-binding protein [Candidatus Jettenia sp.]GAB62734.1 putative phage transcriptional regulator [Candidatus Jettenia caeni]KAA0249451.1 MAG: DNA-binding protein [Candidatus Jettenia sp. AMX1]MCE7879231.1 DNA-binding protein [Candidatus Jettenia sp. AMX1]MCQ3925952.1 DNA-binding protein [Candidatus Jettenia sp.]